MRAQRGSAEAGLVIDGTGRDMSKIAQQKRQLESIGYDTYMIFVNTSLEVALERNRKRARKVQEDLVRKFWQDVQDSMGGFQRLFGGNFSIVDNSSHDNGDVLKDVWKSVKKFSGRPVKNRVGKAWIEAELEKKRKSWSRYTS